MKFINYLEKIIGVDVYALSSFIIFFLFFIGVVLWVWKADKKPCSKLAIFRWRKITTINNAKIVHNNKTNNNERIFQQNQKQ